MNILLNRADALRQRALDAVDAFYGVKINTTIGPLGVLHSLKRAQAQSGKGPLLSDENDKIAILANAEQQDKAVAELDQLRIAAKKEIRKSKKAAKIREILAQHEIPMQEPINGRWQL